MTGQCECDAKYTGLKCDKCAPGRYNFPFCLRKFYNLRFTILDTL